MISFDLDPWLAKRRTKIDAILDQKLALSGDDPGRLIEAMRYSLLAPGKRLRPLLVIAAAEAASTPLSESVLLAAGAVELVHCYSLIHDDLPAMDNDDFRRGRPTNHKVFSDAMAILAGDALLTLAFQWLAEAAQHGGPLASERSLRAVLALARGAGMKGMVRGQARDVTPKDNPTLEYLETLHEEKTGALFRAAMEVGAAMAGATPAQYEALAHFGTCYGIAFQHRDDQSDHENLGFAESTRKRIPELCSEAIRSLQGFGESAEVLRTMALRLDLR